MDPKQQMLMAMGLGLLGGGSANFGKNLSRGGLLGMQAYNQAQQMQMREDEKKQQAEMRAQQMAQMKQQQEAQAAQQARVQQFMQSRPDLAAQYAVDPQGAIKRAFPGEQKPIALNPGQVLFDPAKGKELFAAPQKSKFEPGATRELKMGSKVVTQEYDGKGWKTIGQSPLWKPDAPEKGPAAPQGYRWKADGSGLEPIPGGPADQKAGIAAEKDKRRAEGALARADVVLGRVKGAIDKVGATTTGAIGAVARNIPGTSAFNLNKELDTIRANIGFQELQAMREASPTGGALGQVAVQELNMLQSVLGSLDTAQSDDQLLQSLYAIEKHFSNWKRAVEESQTGAKESPKSWSIQRVN